MLPILREKIRRDLAQIILEQTRFALKYGMSFEEHKPRWESEDRPEDYSFEAETDYLAWEALATRKARLGGLLGQNTESEENV
jgi:hypothetical protein